MNLFQKPKLELHIFQQSLILVSHPTPNTRQEQNHSGSKAHPSYQHAQQFPSVNVSNHTDTERNMPIVGLEPTQFVSESYCLKCLGYIKKYADSGTRINVVYFRMLLLARIELLRLHNEINRQWDSKKNRLFSKATRRTL